jgi:hypothetical protein
MTPQLLNRTTHCYLAEPANPAISDLPKYPKEPPTVASNDQLPNSCFAFVQVRRLSSRRVRGYPGRRDDGTTDRGADTDRGAKCTSNSKRHACVPVRRLSPTLRRGTRGVSHSSPPASVSLASPALFTIAPACRLRMGRGRRSHDRRRVKLRQEDRERDSTWT